MPDDPRAPRPEELAKIVAEAEKLRAETRVIEAKAVLDLREMEAKASKAEAEAAEAEITLGRRRREELEQRAADKFHHRYHFKATVSSTSVSECVSALNIWNRTEPGCSIEIVFTSPGGSVLDGFVLFDYISQLRSQGHHVTTSTLGMAASMAGILLQAGDHRVMYKEAWVLIHEIAFGAIGKIGEIEDTVDWARRIQERVLDIFSARCHQAGINGTAKRPLTKATLRKGWRRKDWWISSEECLAYGLVDEVR